MLRIDCEQPKKRKPLFDVLQIFLKKEDIVFCKENADLKVGKDTAFFDKKYPYRNILEMKQVVYQILRKKFQTESPWGILTGSKPMKLYRQVGEETLKEKYFVSKEKIRLLNQIGNYQKGISLRPKKINLYINIPFCTTRCAYCSFPTIVKPRYHTRYVELLEKEIRAVASVTKSKIRTVYFGGGTPTTLSAKELGRIFRTLYQYFDLSEVEEWTVEAGREDSLTEEKLKVIKEHSATRISLNPQTFHPEVLRKIGRKQDNDRLIDWYHRAKELGFIVNMDFILGLESETLSDVEKNMQMVKQLSPDNVTVHTLAIKKGSKYEEHDFQSTANIKQAVDLTREFLTANGWDPYYLYRQKQILGNFENIGYAKKGTRSIYNILINEEWETIIGLGMAANSKFVGEKISYLTNAKDLQTYEETLDQKIEEKKEMIR